MGSQTPALALPYPVGTDRVMDGDNAIQALAERVELMLPRGLLGRATITGNVAVGAAVTDVPGLSVPLTLPAARLIRLSLIATTTFTSGTGQATLFLREGATTLQAVGVTHTAAGALLPGVAAVVLAPTAGAHTYVVSASCSAGAASIVASATSPVALLVEDLGKV